MLFNVNEGSSKKIVTSIVKWNKVVIRKKGDHMTVVECIVTWLNSYTELKFSLDEPDMLEKTGDVETELMSTDKLVIELIDGSRIVTEN